MSPMIFVLVVMNALVAAAALVVGRHVRDRRGARLATPRRWETGLVGIAALCAAAVAADALSRVVAGEDQPRDAVVGAAATLTAGLALASAVDRAQERLSAFIAGIAWSIGALNLAAIESTAGSEVVAMLATGLSLSAWALIPVPGGDPRRSTETGAVTRKDLDRTEEW